MESIYGLIEGMGEACDPANCRTDFWRTFFRWKFPAKFTLIGKDVGLRNGTV